MTDEIFNATIEYAIDFRLDGEREWKPVKNWNRPFFESRKLDETLDEGNLTMNCAELQDLPPYTELRLTTITTDGEETRTEYSYFVTQQCGLNQRTYS